MLRLIAWDFDGVLNANIRDGRFIWADTFEADLGVSLESFTGYVFASHRFREVLVGARDLGDLLEAWVADAGLSLTAAEVMEYWFRKDSHPDAQLLALSQRLAQRQVIATNNEAHRAAYIWGEMGYSARMEQIFAAGPMGVKKPDTVFFEEITEWAGCAPSEALLVDDHPPNVEAAKGLGWETFYFNDETRGGLEARLRALGAL